MPHWRSVYWVDELGHCPASLLQIVKVVTECKGELGCSSDDARYADHSANADQHVHDLIDGCSCTHRRVGLLTEGRFGGTHRHQRCEPDKRQGLRIEACGINEKADLLTCGACFIDGQATQSLHVVRSHVILHISGLHGLIPAPGVGEAAMRNGSNRPTIERFGRHSIT
jgi:hypothetical protein